MELKTYADELFEKLAGFKTLRRLEVGMLKPKHIERLMALPIS